MLGERTSSGPETGFLSQLLLMYRAEVEKLIRSHEEFLSQLYAVDTYVPNPHADGFSAEACIDELGRAAAAELGVDVSPSSASSHDGAELARVLPSSA